MVARHIIEVYEYVKSRNPKVSVGFNLGGIVSRGGPGSNPDVVGNIVYGSKGYLSTAGGFKIFLGKEQQPGPADLNAPMEEAVPSMTLIHLANISYQLGRSLHFDAATMSCRNDPEANRMFTRTYRAPFLVPEKV